MTHTVQLQMRAFKALDLMRAASEPVTRGLHVVCDSAMSVDVIADATHACSCTVANSKRVSCAVNASMD